MDLEAKVKAYAEEARRILLQRHLDERKPHGGKAYWQGYADTGNAIVKQDGVFKLVKVIGNVAVPKDTPVYIDQQNTVTVGFKKTVPVVAGGKKATLKPTTAERLKKPLIEFVEEFAIGDFFLYYGYKDYMDVSNFINLFGVGIDGNYNQSSSGVGIYGTNTLSVTNYSNNNTNKSTYHFAGFAAHVTGLNFFSSTREAFVTLSGTPIDTECRIVWSNGVAADSVAISSFGAYSGDYTATIDWQANGSSNNGTADFSFRAAFFTPPQTEYYIQSAPNEEGQDTYVQLDLQDYFTDTVVFYDELHTYTKKIQLDVDESEATSYLIFYVRTCDFSYQEHYTYQQSTYYDNDQRIIGRLKHFYLHLKIEHATQSITHRATEQTRMWNGNNLDTSIYVDGNPMTSYHLNLRINRDIFAYIDNYNVGNAILSHPNTNIELANKSPTEYSSHDIGPSYQDILSQAFEGDWLYDWRNVQIGDYVANFDQFLRMHFYDGTWYYHSMNGGPLYWSSFRQHTPVEGENGYDGLPADDTASSITDLVNLLETKASTFFSDYFSESGDGPNVYDDWVQWLGSGYNGYLSGGPSGPDYNSQVPEANRRRVWFSYAQSNPPAQSP